MLPSYSLFDTCGCTRKEQREDISILKLGTAVGVCMFVCPDHSLNFHSHASMK